MVNNHHQDLQNGHTAVRESRSVNYHQGDGHDHPVHIHRERTIIKESQDDYFCDEEGCYELLRDVPPPGIISRVKHFIFGPTTTEEEKRDAEIRVVRMKGKGVGEAGRWYDEATGKIRQVGSDVNEGMEDVRDRYENVKGDARYKYENVKGDARHKYENVKGDVRNKYEDVKGDVRHQYEDLKGTARHKYEDVKGDARDKYEDAQEGYDEVRRKVVDMREEGKEAAGGILNSIRQVGSKIADAVNINKHRVEDSVHQAEQKYKTQKDHARYKVEQGKRVVESSVSDIKEQGDRVKHRVEKEVEEGKADVKDWVEKGKHRIQNAQDEAKVKFDRQKQQAQESAETLVHRVEETIDDVKQRVKQGYHSVEETAEEIALRTKQNLDRAKQNIKDAANHGVEQVRDAADAVRSSVEHTANRVQSGVDTAKYRVSHAAERVKEDVYETLEDVKEGVHERVEDVKEGLESVWHKAEGAAECLGCVGPRKYGNVGAQRIGGPWYGQQRVGADPFAVASPVPVTAFWTALSMMWFLWLARRVWQTRQRTRIYVGDGSADLAHELGKDVVVSRTTLSEGRAEKTTAVLHTENVAGVSKYLQVSTIKKTTHNPGFEPQHDVSHTLCFPSCSNRPQPSHSKPPTHPPSSSSSSSSKYRGYTDPSSTSSRSCIFSARSARPSLE
ncbi:hypothetical protein BC832DRAFT_556973 [Gaertneriomyces semiglobifer]|nr:hypothetical protein BC832DRAFT_556973 [Gaertneriomyces semiglobifer]